MSKNFDGRLRFLSLAVLLFAGVLITKLYFVQIVKGDVFRSKADHQYVEGSNFFDRGSIFFTTKDGAKVPAAGIQSGYIVSINPQIFVEHSTNLEEVFSKLSTVADFDKNLFMQKAAKITDPYEEIARRMPLEVAEKVKKLEIPGVSIYKEDWRVYPGETMAAHAVGFVGYGGEDGTELAGRYGLERFYEPTLKRSGDSAFVNFFAEVFSDIKKTIDPNETLEGDIVTTIEPSVQSMMEEELRKLQSRYQSEFSGGIVIDPKTGAIVSMALTPTFDPNTPQSAGSAAVFQNALVENRYEMGSIIKALTMAAGLDSGAITPKTTFNDPGCMTLNQKTFCNYDGESHGNNLPMQVILDKSLNTGATFIVQKMGNDLFRKYMYAYGLASTTGIDLPNEGKSLVSNLQSSRDLEYAQASFGQGIALTAVQTVRALSTLANGGYLITPHLVKEIHYKIGTKKNVQPDRGEKIFNSGTSEAVSRMLTEVVDTALKNGSVRLENYSVAAKTGTAQIANPNGGGYYADHYLHSFFGYFPSYEPRFLIFLFTYYPKEVQYASETLTDSFMNLTKFLISYYTIPPDREAPPPPTKKPK